MLFDYNNNIKVITTVNGDKVISFNKEIYTRLLNAIYDATEYHLEHNRKATADDLKRMGLIPHLLDERRL